MLLRFQVFGLGRDELLGRPVKKATYKWDCIHSTTLLLLHQNLECRTVTRYYHQSDSFAAVFFSHENRSLIQTNLPPLHDYLIITGLFTTLKPNRHSTIWMSTDYERQNPRGYSLPDERLPAALLRGTLRDRLSSILQDALKFWTYNIYEKHARTFDCCI